MTDGTRPETSAFIGPHYQPAAEADRPDFYPTVLDLVISFFQDEWIEIPHVWGAVRGSDVWRKLWSGGLGWGWVRVLLLMIYSGFSFFSCSTCFLLVEKSKFFKMKLLHQVKYRGRYCVVLQYSRSMLKTKYESFVFEFEHLYLND